MQNLNLIILSFFAAWLVLLSVLYYNFYSIYKKLTKNINTSDLKKILEKIISEGEINTKEIKLLKNRLELLEKNAKSHIQKVGLIRFNPFKELGGDHSFSLAILDDYNSGIIITSLHTRDRTRVYMKDVSNGKSKVELSDEEKKALVDAQRGK